MTEPTAEPHREFILFGRREYSALIVAIIVGVTNWALYSSVGFAPMVIIGGSGVVALVVWLGTTYRHPVQYHRVLPLYLVLIAAELVHMAEEYVTGFPHSVSELTGATMTQGVFVVVFVIGGTALALLSAIGLMYRNPIANYVLWFVIIGPGFVNGIAHVLFPIMAGQYYFPGLATVTIPVVVGVVLGVKVYRESRNAENIAAPERG